MEKVLKTNINFMSDITNYAENYINKKTRFSDNQKSSFATKNLLF